MFHVPEDARITKGFGIMNSTSLDGNNGCFILRRKGATLHIQASDGLGWEHVSISLNHRVPQWGEMCFVKSIFWDDEDCVVQYHPPKSKYVNCHEYCLHLFRPIDVEMPQPPSELIGPKT